MLGVIPPLLQYALMAWCSVKKAQGQFYLLLHLCLYLYNSYRMPHLLMLFCQLSFLETHGSNLSRVAVIPTDFSVVSFSLSRRMLEQTIVAFFQIYTYNL
jgi:hypothetical protein